jgi:predicted homoserine dehydrogenase-like protein
MGPGPFYAFYRPYHLGHIEAMACVAEAVLDGTALLQPAHGLCTNVFAYAKRDLRAGEVLDGPGGYACYGLIENSADNLDRPGLPICLSADAKILVDLPRDAKVLLRDVELDPNRADLRLFARAVEESDRRRR